ncbi:hypothetical protein ACG0Z5_14440 [Scandinavium sp. M-37]|jgi:hypothetical protein|uniref:hypothetical protein n=1 Tax=Scandinavium sp. M-37 TaxID=3373077 RepID=UPI003745591D
MPNQYFWINHNGSKEIAVFLPELIEDVTTGESIFGMWRLASDPDEVLFLHEIQVLSGPLTPPV